MSIITTLIGRLKKVLQQAKQKQQLRQQQQQQQITADAGRKNNFLLLPYKGEKGEHIIKSMKRRISKLLPPEMQTQVVYAVKKLVLVLMQKTKVNSTINMTWYTMHIALMRHIEKITLVRVVASKQ